MKDELKAVVVEYVLVPREPTDEMVNAFHAAGGLHGYHSAVQSGLRSAIATAAKAPPGYELVPSVFMDTLEQAAGKMLNGNRMREEVRGIRAAAIRPPAASAEAREGEWQEIDLREVEWHIERETFPESCGTKPGGRHVFRYRRIQ